jgi:tRNA threonylcarbamoyladenosine biosynthesis protein TsaE
MISEFCGPQDDIPSPTFTLVQPYPSAAGFEIWHLDLYRLETAEQALALGIEDAFYACCCLIEWPDKLQDLLPVDQIRVDLAMGSDIESRVVALAAEPEILDQFKQSYFS